MPAAGMPTLRKPRSVGQPVSWWCLRPETWASPLVAGYLFTCTSEISTPSILRNSISNTLRNEGMSS